MNEKPKGKPVTFSEQLNGSHPVRFVSVMMAIVSIVALVFTIIHLYGLRALIGTVLGVLSGAMIVLAILSIWDATKKAD